MKQAVGRAVAAGQVLFEIVQHYTFRPSNQQFLPDVSSS